MFNYDKVKIIYNERQSQEIVRLKEYVVNEYFLQQLYKIKPYQLV